MARLPERIAVLALALLWAAPAAAQARPASATAPATSPIEVYRREVFTYQRAGRPDPFQPLLSAADLGYRIEDLRLTSIIYSPDPRASVAVFALADSARRFRLRTGQRLGGITVAAIHPRRVDLRVEEFGVGRIESVVLQRATRNEADAARGGNSPTQGQPVIVQPAPQARPEPRAPLRRGGARNNAPPDASRPAPTRSGTPSPSNR